MSEQENRIALERLVQAFQERGADAIAETSESKLPE